MKYFGTITFKHSVSLSGFWRTFESKGCVKSQPDFFITADNPQSSLISLSVYSPVTYIKHKSSPHLSPSPSTTSLNMWFSTSTLLSWVLTWSNASRPGSSSTIDMSSSKQVQREGMKMEHPSCEERGLLDLECFITGAYSILRRFQGDFVLKVSWRGLWTWSDEMCPCPWQEVKPDNL